MVEDYEALPGFGPFRLDLEVPVLYKDGREVRLRKRARLVLKCLFENPRGLNLEQLERCAWGQNTYVSDKTKRNTVGEIRAALGPEFGSWVKNRPGSGYVLEIPERARRGVRSERAPDFKSDSSNIGRFHEVDLPPLQPLFGRSRELSALDRAYKNSRTRLAIISGRIGGEGKTQLVQRWLRNTYATGRKDLMVFAFSFNSQGTAETRQTSSDPFFNEALSWFEVEVGLNALPDEKARRLAGAIIEREAVLYLDGIEPLQAETAGDVAPLRDSAMRMLLHHLARLGDHFCLVSTRYMVQELLGNPCVKQIELKGLDPRDAVKLLASYGLSDERGQTAESLRTLAKRWDFHPLSLVLLATYLAKYFEGDVREAGVTRQLAKKGEPLAVPYKPELMVEAHERRLAKTNEAALQLLRLLGLFDRPVDERWVEELASPPISCISEKLKPAWLNLNMRNMTIKLLTDLKLIGTKDGISTRRIYCHPLVQHHVGQLVRRKFPTAWRQANSRLFQYFAELVRHARPQTPREMLMLYQSVAHGCAAGQYRQAFDEVYWPRISQEDTWFSTDHLGLVAEDLACLASFFEQPFVTLAKSLNGTRLGARILSLAGFGLRTLGRLDHAEQAIKQALVCFEKLRLWEAASGEANNLAVLYRMQGRLGQALSEGKKALKYAEYTRNVRLIVARLAALGEFHHYHGNLDQALEDFKSAEARLRNRYPESHLLSSTLGFRYCELLLTLGKTPEVLKRARHIPTGSMTRYRLLDEALSLLCEARALMATGTGARELSRAEKLLRRSNELVKKSQHRDNQIRVTLALCECLRLKGRSGLREAGDLVQAALDLADTTKMYLHRLDCEFELLQIQLATRVASGMRTRLHELSQRAREIHYGLLSMRIRKLAGPSLDLGPSHGTGTQDRLCLE